MLPVLICVLLEVNRVLWSLVDGVLRVAWHTWYDSWMTAMRVRLSQPQGAIELFHESVASIFEYLESNPHAYCRKTRHAYVQMLKRASYRLA